MTKFENKYSDQNNKYFRATSFYLATFLFAKGLTLINIDKTTNPKKAQFVFNDSPDQKLWSENFNFAKDNSHEAMIDARKFVMAIKILKDKLY